MGGGGVLFGPKWNSSLRKWPLWLIIFCWTDNLRLTYLDTSFISGIDGVYQINLKSTSYSKFS